MSAKFNSGRVAGFLYLLLIVLGPMRLMYIPNKLFVHDNATATVNNIAAQEWLFRIGIASDMVCVVILIFLVMAFYRLFKEVDQYLAVLVVIFGGVMPSIIYLINVVSDYGALMIIRGADFLSVFDKPQRDALVMLLLRLHDQQNNAAEILWGVWLLPLAILTYKSRFLPRFLGVWLFLAGCGWLMLCFTGLLLPHYQHNVYVITQPAVLGEIAFTLWLVIKGAKRPVRGPATSSSPLL